MTSEAEVAVRDPREPSPIEGMITAYRDQFALILPSHADPDRFVRWCLGYLRQFDGTRREASAIIKPCGGCCHGLRVRS